MFRNNKIKRSSKTAAATCALLVVAGFSGAALAAPLVEEQPRSHLNITNVEVQSDLNTITIEIDGEDLDFGQPLQITLAGVDITFNCSWIVQIVNTNKIICEFDRGSLAAGDYELNVSTGTGQSQSDEYTLTIGSVRPQDDLGADSAQGPKGDSVPGPLSTHGTQHRTYNPSCGEHLDFSRPCS